MDLLCDEKPNTEIKGALSCSNMLDNKRLIDYAKFNEGVDG